MAADDEPTPGARRRRRRRDQPVRVRGAARRARRALPPDRRDGALHLRRRRAAAAAPRRGLRAGLGDRLGGARQRPPAAAPRPAGELPVLTFDGRARFGTAHWKLEALDDYAGDRPLAWIDDSLDESCHEWARQRAAPTLLCPTESHIGLTEAHTEALLAWARDGYTADGPRRGRGTEHGGRLPTDLLPDGGAEDPRRAAPLPGLVGVPGETQPEEAPPDSDDHRFRRFRRQPKRPRGPRRGDHGPDALPLPDCPPGGRDPTSAPRPHRHCGARCSERRGSRDKGGALALRARARARDARALASTASANDPVYGVVPQDGAVPSGQSRPDGPGGATRSASLLWWAGVEPSRGHLRLERHGRRRPRDHRHGVKPFFFLYGTPTWATTRTGAEAAATAIAPSIHPPRPRRGGVADFAAAAVKRYGPGGDFWEPSQARVLPEVGLRPDAKGIPCVPLPPPRCDPTEPPTRHPRRRRPETRRRRRRRLRRRRTAAAARSAALRLHGRPAAARPGSSGTSRTRRSTTRPRSTSPTTRSW